MYTLLYYICIYIILKFPLSKFLSVNLYMIITTSEYNKFSAIKEENEKLWNKEGCNFGK